MRVVLDTNLVVSGLLWHGPPRQVLDESRTGMLELFTSAALLRELEEVLSRDKFAPRFQLAGVTPVDLVVGYAALATPIESPDILPVILEDPDDDDVLACALAAQSEAIASGDTHLLRLKEYEEIPIVTAAELLQRIKDERRLRKPGVNHE